MVKKNKLKKLVNREFTTIGMVLIVYGMFVLFIPTLLESLFELSGFELKNIYGIDSKYLIKLGLLIFGTIIPFLLLKLATPKKEKVNKVKLSLKETIYQFIVFFSCVSFAIFLTVSIANYFHIPGKFISSIGLTLNDENMLNPFYVILYIIVTPILEEFAFRNVLLNSLSRFGKNFAVYACATLFALAHGSFLEMIPAFIMGLLLDKLALRCKSILPSIRVHILFNLTLYLLFVIPSDYQIFVIIGLLLIYIIAILLYVFRIYQRITVKRQDNRGYVFKLFNTNFFVIVSSILFILHSVLVIFLA